jgi:hypothetical protein
METPTPTPAPAAPRRSAVKVAVRVAVSVAVGVGLLWWSLRNVNWASARAALAAAEWIYLAPYVLSLVFIHLMRTLRWGELLKPIDRVPFGRLLAVSSIGLAAIILLPLRLGEFVRPMLIRDGRKIRFGAALATVAAERVIDGLLVAALIFVLLMTLPAYGPLDPAWAGLLRRWGFGFGAVFVLGFVVLLLAHRDRERFRRLVSRALFFSARLRTLVERTVVTFADGLAGISSPRQLATFLAYTFAYWGINGVGMWWLFRAFHLPVGLGASYAVMSFLVIGVMIPGGPGALGNFELFGRWGMLMFLPAALVDSTGVAYILILHVTQLVTQTLFALLFLGSGDASAAGTIDALRRTLAGDLGGGDDAGEAGGPRAASGGDGGAAATSATATVTRQARA